MRCPPKKPFIKWRDECVFITAESIGHWIQSAHYILYKKGESDTNLDLLNSEPCVDCQKITPPWSKGSREDKNNTFLPCTAFLFLLDWFQLQGLEALLKRLSEATLSWDSCLLFLHYMPGIVFLLDYTFKTFFPPIQCEKNRASIFSQLIKL